jgi:hypothetical protein
MENTKVHQEVSKREKKKRAGISITKSSQSMEKGQVYPQAMRNPNA